MTNQTTSAIFSSAVSVFENMQEQVKAVGAQFVLEQFWGEVKSSRSLNEAFYQYNFNDCEKSARILVKALQEVISDNLPGHMQEAIADRVKAFELHYQVSSVYDRDDEQSVWVAWERQAEQDAVTEKMELYYNEY